MEFGVCYFLLAISVVAVLFGHHVPELPLGKSDLLLLIIYGM